MQRGPKLTQEMRLDAALQVARAIVDDEGSQERMARDIADSQESDGFAIGKYLDRQGWDVDAGMVEALDGFYSYLDAVMEGARKRWAENHNIQPPLPVGAETTKGVITGLCSHRAACYLIKPYGQDDELTGNRRLLVKFEDVVEKESAA